MKNKTLLLTLFASTAVLTGTSFADIDCSQYDGDCNDSSFTCTCVQNTDGTVSLTMLDTSRSNGSTGYEYYQTFNEDKKLIKRETAYIYEGDTSPSELTISDFTYDDKGREAESTTMRYAYNYDYPDNISGYSKATYNYDSDDATQYSSYDYISVDGSQGGGNGQVSVEINGMRMQLKGSVALSNDNIEQIKQLVNSGDVEAVLAFTGGEVSGCGSMCSIKTNQQGILYKYKRPGGVTEMYIQNEDGSINVYEVNLTNNEAKNADPRTMNNATFKGKYDSLTKYYLNDVLGYSNIIKTQNADGSYTLYDRKGNFKGFKGKRIYTLEEANAITGSNNRISIKYR